MRRTTMGMAMAALAAAALGCSTSAVTRPASAVAGGVSGVGSAVAGGVAGAGSAVAGGVAGAGSAVAGGVAGVGSAVTGTAVGPAGLVAILRPVNSVGTVDGSVSLGKVTFKQGSGGQLTVLAQVGGISVAGQERTMAVEGGDVFYSHGLHVHSGGSCAATTQDGKVVPAGAAGPHYDPAATNSHKGPQGAGHAGDLPNVKILNDGTGIMETTTSRFTLGDLVGKTVILHANPDNYTDTPVNGGSGARIACGVIEPAR
ncbi:MAG: superoxide dismutase family protein [Alphaproteobacteria bacterium]